MQTVKLNSISADVTVLQRILKSLSYTITINGCFDSLTDMAVRKYQKTKGLKDDGIVGSVTWNSFSDFTVSTISETDFQNAAKTLGTSVPTIKAVKEVESGSKSFFAYGLPAILFEGHIFFQQLLKDKIDPAKYIKGNEDIIYKTWTKEFYKGGLDEYVRLERARAIHDNAALNSASYGMFQIMGNNHVACGFSSVTSYVESVAKGEKEQLTAFVNFIKNNNLATYLKNLDWAGFAKRYNGPSYATNKYDEKLAVAYKKHGGK